MASTGMLLKGKQSHVTVNGTIYERVGDLTLPETTTNDETEIVSDFATRKEVIPKGGFENFTFTPIFRPEFYKTFLEMKAGGSLCTVTVNSAAPDGGTLSFTYNGEIMRVGGPTAAMPGSFEGFDVEMKIIAMGTDSTGALGSQVYNE